MSYPTFGAAAPYFDDYNVQNNFLRIMFNPSRAVQARELTQSQTILQNQIQQIASDLFQDNAKVSGAEITLSNSVPAVQIGQFALVYNSGTSSWSQSTTSVITPDSTWIGRVFQNTDPNNNTLTPSQIIEITGVEVNPGENPVLYYTFSGSDVTSGQSLYDSGNLGNSVGGFVVAAAPTRAVVASCSEGTIWTRGFFVYVPAQSVVISNTSTTGNYNVGFTLAENIITSQNPTLGTTLLDPANGSYNFNAPGADRYQITATLGFYDVTQTSTLGNTFLSNFIPFVQILNGALIPLTAPTSQLGAIGDVLASRTFDANGDFVVENFKINLIEANGFINPALQASYPGFVAGDTDLNDYLVAQISPGRAYVDGYDIQKVFTTNVLVRKGRDLQTITNGVLTLVSPFYVVANLQQQNNIGSAQIDGSGTVSGSTSSWLAFNQMEVVQVMSGAGGQGRVLTEARIQSIDRQGDLVRIFLIETNVEALTATVFVAGSAYTAGTYVFVNNGSLEGQIFEALANVTNAISPANDPTNWDFVANSNYPTTGPVVDEIKFNNFNAARSIRSLANPGTYVNIALSSSGVNGLPMNGSNPAPLMYSVPGVAVLDSVSPTVIAHAIGTYTTTLNSTLQTTITADSLNVTFTLPSEDGLIYAFINSSTVAGLTNQLVDVSQVGGSTSSNTITLDFSQLTIGGAHLASGDTVTVALLETNSQAQARAKTINTATDTFTVSSPTTDVLVLSNEDVINIVSIVQTTNNANLSVSRSFSQAELLQLLFDNGQRDCYYDYGSISNFSSLWASPNKAAVKSGGAYVSTTYEITYQYYTHENNPDKLFFSVASYTNITSPDNYDQIPPYRSALYGNIDPLNVFDYRRKVSELGNSSNPLKLPLPFDQVVIPSIQHYVGHYASVALDANGNFVVTNGVASETPTQPTTSPKLMNLWMLGIPPYTFSSKQVSISQTNNAVYTMLDIYEIDQRLKRVETQIELSALEQQASSSTPIDNVTGQPSFISGIFTDTFASFANANPEDPQFNISINTSGPNLATPVQFWNITLSPVTAATTATIDPNLITLPILSQNVLCQNLTATTPIFVNPPLKNVRATVHLNPSVDTWYDPAYFPVQTVTTGAAAPAPGFNPNIPVDIIQKHWVGKDPISPISQTGPATQTAPTASSATSSSTNTSSQSSGNLADFINPLDYYYRPGSRPTMPGAVWGKTFLNADSIRLKRVTAAESTAVPPMTLPQLTQFKALGNPALSSGTTNPVTPISIQGSYQTVSSSKLSIATTPTTTKPYTSTDTLIQNPKKTSTKIIDESLVPFVRSRTVSFVGSGFQPQSTLTATLDGNPVNLVVDSMYLDKSGNYTTDGFGNISGQLLLPAGKFLAGSRVLLLSDANGGSASSYYSSGGIMIDGSTPSVRHSGPVNNTQNVSSSSNIAANIGIVNNPVPPVFSNGAEINSYGILQTPTVNTRHSVLGNPQIGYDGFLAFPAVDPFAQSFNVSQSTGVFLSSIELYFATKSGDFSNTTTQINGQPLATLLKSLYGVNNNYPPYPPVDPISNNNAFVNTIPNTNIPLTLYIVEMVNGVPSSNVVPLSQVVVYPSAINSNPLIPASGATTINFPDPVYLKGNTSYAIVCRSSSNEYSFWRSVVGRQDIFQNGSNAPGAVSNQQPFVGTLFKSNGSNWTPRPETNLTFTLYYAQFASSATLTLQDAKTIDDNSYAQNSNTVWTAAGTYTPGEVVFYNWYVNGASVSGFFELGGTASLPANSVAPVTVASNIATVNSPWIELVDGAYSSTLMPARYISSIIPMIGNMTLNGTSLEFNHLFFQGSSIPSSPTYSTFNNYTINDVTSIGSITGVEKQLDDNGASAQSYAVQIAMATTNPNLTPVVDTQQLRGIGVRNMVRGVDPILLYGGLTTSALLNTVNSSGLAAAQALGEVAFNVAYSQNAVVFYPSAPNTFYYYTGTSAKTYVSTGGDLETQFFADIATGLWKIAVGYVPPFIDGIPGVGDAGSYVSQTVNLAQEADNLLLTLDVLKINASYVNVYYKTQTNSSNYIYTSPYTDSEGVGTMSNLIGQTMKVKYRGTTGNAAALSNQIPGGGSFNPLVTISGVEPIAGSRSKISLSAVSEDDAFAEGLTYNSVGGILSYQTFQTGNANFANVLEILLIPQTITDLDSLTTLADWASASAYAPGNVVCTEVSGTGIETSNFRIWLSNGYIAAVWSSTTAYAINNIVIISGGVGKPFLAYQAVAANTNVNPTTDNGSNWKLLLGTDGTPASAFGLGTTPTTLGTAWTEIPSISVRSAVKSETSNSWQPMVPTTTVDSSQLVNGNFYEYGYKPKVAPPAPFSSFAVRVDLRTNGDDRISIPTVKNLKVIATY